MGHLTVTLGVHRTFIADTVALREERKAAYEKATGGASLENASSAASWTAPGGAYDDVDLMATEGRAVGVLAANAKYGDDVNGLRELIVYVVGRCYVLVVGAKTLTCAPASSSGTA